MTRWPLLVLGLLVGCVPLSAHRQMEKKYRTALQANGELLYDVDRCRDRTVELEEQLKKKPTTVVVPGPSKTIDPAELEEIKRKAYEEAEQKFRLRLKGLQHPTASP